jgi:hypothetical protein
VLPILITLCFQQITPPSPDQLSYAPCFCLFLSILQPSSSHLQRVEYFEKAVHSASQACASFDPYFNPSSPEPQGVEGEYFLELQRERDLARTYIPPFSLRQLRAIKTIMTKYLCNLTLKSCCILSLQAFNYLHSRS